MQDLIIRDVRLEGARPAGNEVLEVDANTPLDWPISWLLSKSTAYGGDVRARIMAHGIGFYSAATVGNYGVSHPQYSQGGAGIQFCKQGIRLATLDKFVPLRGKLPRIDILGCGAAYITPGLENREGDGNLLCYRLAQIIQATVRASTATQVYDPDGAINFGKWEGTVLTYAPSGAVIKVESAPAE
jgi:hypothetical protein